MKTTNRYAPKGYVCIDKQLARAMFEVGLEVTAYGNNVNSANVFGGWYLGYTFALEGYYSEETEDFDAEAFDKRINNFLMYLDRQLGTYPVFCVSLEDYDAFLAFKGVR